MAASVVFLSIMLDNEYGFNRNAGVGRAYNNDYGFPKRRNKSSDMALHELEDGKSKVRTPDLFTEIHIVASDSNSWKDYQQFTALKQRQLISYTIFSKHFLTLQEKTRLWKYVAEFAQKCLWGRTDNRRIIEFQLLNWGIEPNPGPMEQTAN